MRKHFSEWERSEIERMRRKKTGMMVAVTLAFFSMSKYIK